MKKLIFLFALALSLCATNKLQAYDFSAVNADGVTIYYNITSATTQEVEVTYETNSYNSYSSVVNIPSEVTNEGITYTVTEIGNYAFKDCTALTSVTIPEGVSTIGNYAFQNCSRLTSIIIPESVTSFGSYAFRDCSSLTSITIPENVTEIGNSAFKDCTTLASITIPESVTSIRSSAFQNCSSLTSITIPNRVSTIFSYTFYNCSGLTSVTIPNSVSTIGGRAFEGCRRLTSITIPEGVSTIGNSAFQNCSGLTSVTIPENVTEIGNSVFLGCRSLTSVTIPNISTINYSTFYNCSALEVVVLGARVSNIGNKAFALSSESDQELTIYSLNATPPTTGTEVIEGSNVKVIVQCEAETAYQNIDTTGANWLGLSDDRITPKAINAVYQDVAWENGSYSGNGFEIDNVGNGGVFERTEPNTGCEILKLLQLNVVPRSGILTSKAGEWAAENAGAWTQTSAETTQWIVSNGSAVTFNSQPETGTITVKDGGELIAEVELSNVTVEKTIVPNQWNFMGFPIKETNGVEYLAQGTGNIWALGFNYYQSNWDDNYLYWNDNAHSLVVQGNGIFVYPEEANTFKITGTVPASGSTISVTNPVSGPVQTGRYMALANPYAEKLDVATFLANANSGANPLIIQGEVVYRYNEENGNSSYIALSEGEVEVGEGFFVNMSDGYVTVNIDNSPVSQAKSTPREFLTLSVSTNGYKVPVKFAVNEAASQDYDIYDANKMFGSGTVAEPYLLSNNVMLCKEEVDCLPYTTNMNVRTHEACSVEITADRIPEQYTLTLVDSEEEIPMKEGDTYTAELINGENSNRFQLKIGKGAVSIQDIAQAETLDIRANNRHITISCAANATTVVYNALGQKVYETKAHSFDLNGIEAGAYIVKTTSGNLSHTCKIIIY